MYCYSPIVANLQELREKAKDIGESVTIHHHAYGELCSMYEHEIHSNRKDEENVKL